MFGALTVLVAVVLPPPQLNVAPAVVELAVSVVFVFVQVNCAGGAMLKFGGVMFWVTVVLVVAVHPLLGSVAVTL